MEEYQEDFIDDEVLRTDGPTPKPISPTKVNENSDITSQRIRRIQKLHLNQVLCMEEEIFYQLDILPTTIQEESSKLSKHNRIEMPSSLTDVRVDEKDSIPSHEGIFDPESEWIKFASNNQVTANELLVNRPLVSLKYCRTRPHLFMTAHEYPINIRDLELDLKPYRGLYCVWNIHKIDTPIYILECSGQPIDCTFSITNSDIIVAGCDDGSLSLWDLSESRHLHLDRDSIELEVKFGIRKPCYRTVQSSTSYQDETLSLQDTLHEASIQQVESIGKSDDDYNSSIESGIFTSLDSNGVLIFWTTKVIPNDSVIDIPGLSVWSNLMLIPIRKMNFMEGKIGSSNRYISTPVIAIVPGNSFSMYASTGGGEVSCFHRLGHGSHTSRQPLKRYRNSENNDPPSEVTCISVSISHSVCKATGLSALLDSDYLVLLGRCDGSIDLFIDKETGAHCIHSWDTTTFKTKSQVSRDLKTKGSYLTNSIVAVYWCPHRPAVFIAVSTDGTVFCFDLLVDLYSPVTSSTLPMYTNTSSSEKSSKLVVELLPLESKGNRRRLMLLVGFENKFHMHTVQARELSYHWIRPCITNDELLQDKNALRCQLTKLII